MAAGWRRLPGLVTWLLQSVALPCLASHVATHHHQAEEVSWDWSAGHNTLL